MVTVFSGITSLMCFRPLRLHGACHGCCKQLHRCNVREFCRIGRTRAVAVVTFWIREEKRWSNSKWVNNAINEKFADCTYSTCLALSTSEFLAVSEGFLRSTHLSHQSLFIVSPTACWSCADRTNDKVCSPKAWSSTQSVLISGTLNFAIRFERYSGTLFWKDPPSLHPTHSKKMYWMSLKVVGWSTGSSVEMWVLFPNWCLLSDDAENLSTVVSLQRRALDSENTATNTLRNFNCRPNSMKSCLMRILQTFEVLQKNSSRMSLKKAHFAWTFFSFLVWSVFYFCVPVPHRLRLAIFWFPGGKLKLLLGPDWKSAQRALPRPLRVALVGSRQATISCWSAIGPSKHGRNA
jgi:hypothetical protein